MFRFGLDNLQFSDPRYRPSYIWAVLSLKYSYRFINQGWAIILKMSLNTG